MRARFAAVIAMLFGFVSLVAVGSAPAAALADKDCSDFNTQAAAQDFFLDNGGPQSDPHGLDADGNGIACESNPCPCSYNTGGGGGGGGGGGTPAKHRFISIKFKSTNNGKQYKLIGTVKPIAQSKRKPANLLRAECKTCKYKPFRSTRTTRKATYKLAHLKRVGWFKVKVPASNGFADSYSKVIRVVAD